MPYINDKVRRSIKDELKDMQDALIDVVKSSNEDISDGLYNYIITSLLEVFPEANTCPEWNYRMINRCIGILECVKMEFYARLARPYEDKKIETEGDLPIYSQDSTHK